MKIEPSSLDDLQSSLRNACIRGEKVRGINLTKMDRILAHVPEDLTVTVEAGVLLGQLQRHLARRRQWLPIDPPNPDHLTVGAMLAINASGPRRLGYGTIRDHLIGIKVALTDGRIIKSGGQVVKNVAGYDLAKLFVGSHGTLGIIVEATFKLQPLPEAEQAVRAGALSWKDAETLLEKILEVEIAPVAIDLHNLSLPDCQHSDELVATLAFAGTQEEVEWQLAQVNGWGFHPLAAPEDATRFWSRPPGPRRMSVLPSRTIETIRGLGSVPWLARAGNGVIYYHGGAPPVKEELPDTLLRRLKEAFDPQHLLPDLPL